jgi:hypothetical protein
MSNPARQGLILIWTKESAYLALSYSFLRGFMLIGRFMKVNWLFNSISATSCIAVSMYFVKLTRFIVPIQSSPRKISARK